MQVKEAMHTGVEWVEPDAPLSTIAKKMRDLDIGAIPVCEKDHLVGMITDRDITCRAVVEGADISKLTASVVMTKVVIYCRDTEDLQDVSPEKGLTSSEARARLRSESKGSSAIRGKAFSSSALIRPAATAVQGHAHGRHIYSPRV